jgi:gluconolactonase
MYHGQVEGTDFVVLDPRFKRLFAGYARVERLWTGARWSEGPAWFGAGRYLVWSDIPNNRMLRYLEPSGHVEVFRTPSNNSNGNTLDNQGRLVTCEHLTRRVTRTEADGSISVVAERWQGKRLNSPNDVVVAADGAVWFTDPPYGIISNREGRIADPEYGGCYVFRLDEGSGELTAMITDMVEPNGLAFSPDERILYVSDTGVLRDSTAPRHIRAYDVIDGRCANSRIFAEISVGVSDGFRVDEEGRVWTSSGDGVRVFTPAGEQILHVPVPEKVANVCFGGPDGHDLYIAASTSLYRIKTTTSNAPRPIPGPA